MKFKTMCIQTLLPLCYMLRIIKNFIKKFEQNFTMGSYGVGIGCAWCFRKACEICSSLVQKKKLKINKFFFTQVAQIAIDQFLVSRSFRD
jgi:hypothetical protein